MRRPTIWYDFNNVPHVHYIKPIVSFLESKGFQSLFTVRHFLETESIFQQSFGCEYQLIGLHKGGNLAKKITGVLGRTKELLKRIPEFDVKISVGGDSSEYVSLLRRKPSITFDDNELAPNWIYSRIPAFSFWTDAVPESVLLKQGFRKDRLYRYHGFKEDIYIADYEPDKEFAQKLPFNEYVLLRSENINANYVPNKSSFIFPEILENLVKKGFNVLVLPRHKIDVTIAKTYHNKVYIPEKPLNGLDACYFAQGVITGAGTLAREAACLGVPAISFFAGKTLMAVDRKLISQHMLYHSRDPERIVSNLMGFKQKTPDLKRSQNVKMEVLMELDAVLEQVLDNGHQLLSR